jgi:hypothetical protein
MCDSSRRAAAQPGNSWGPERTLQTALIIYKVSESALASSSPRRSGQSNRPVALNLQGDPALWDWHPRRSFASCGVAHAESIKQLQPLSETGQEHPL